MTQTKTSPIPTKTNLKHDPTSDFRASVALPTMFVLVLGLNNELMKSIKTYINFNVFGNWSRNSYFLPVTVSFVDRLCSGYEVLRKRSISATTNRLNH